MILPNTNVYLEKKCHSTLLYQDSLAPLPTIFIWLNGNAT